MSHTNLAAGATLLEYPVRVWCSLEVPLLRQSHSAFASNSQLHISGCQGTQALQVCQKLPCVEVRSDVPSNASRFCLLFQLSIEQAQTVAEQVEMKAKVVQSEVKAVTARHKKALEERECELLWKVMGLGYYLSFLRPLPSGLACVRTPASLRDLRGPSSKFRKSW